MTAENQTQNQPQVVTVKPTRKPAAIDLEKSVRPLAVVILATLVIYLPVTVYTAAEEEKTLIPRLESATELAKLCLKLEQEFAFNTNQVGPMLLQLQTAEAISMRREHWVRTLNQCLASLPGEVRVTSLEVTPAVSTVEEASFVFGEEFDSYHEPPSVPALKLRLACELPAGHDAKAGHKQVREILQSVPGVKDFALLDTVIDTKGGISFPILKIEFVIQPLKAT